MGTGFAAVTRPARSATMNSACAGTCGLTVRNKSATLPTWRRITASAMAISWKFLGPAHFPFFLVLGVSLGFQSALALYYALLRLLDTGDPLLAAAKPATPKLAAKGRLSALCGRSCLPEPGIAYREAVTDRPPWKASNLPRKRRLNELATNSEMRGPPRRCGDCADYRTG